ncbi:hypothetical protein KJ603_02680, partial [Patescibacteria group bacterium]|nr:hypothetical protein [Patescibacteria group bacterium]
MMKNKKITIAIILIVIIAAILFFLPKDSESPTLEINQEKNDPEIVINGVEINNKEGAVTPIQEEREVPSLDRKIEFPESLPVEAHEPVTKKINEIVASLKENSDSFDNWLELGIYRKMIEDYEGTEIAWDYASYLEPNKFVVWGNLGDLYALYMRDNTKAEVYYLKALEIGPHQDYLYFKTAQFYLDYIENIGSLGVVLSLKPLNNKLLLWCYLSYKGRINRLNYPIQR